MLVRLHDAEFNELGETRAPAPVGPGDLVANDFGLWRVVDVVQLPAGSPLEAVAPVEPDTLGEQ
jgi:hypothetical protein